MNKIKVSYGETITPKQFESRRFEVELETETTVDVAVESFRLFEVARATIRNQKEQVLKEVEPDKK